MIKKTIKIKLIRHSPTSISYNHKLLNYSRFAHAIKNMISPQLKVKLNKPE